MSCLWQKKPQSFNSAEKTQSLGSAEDGHALIEEYEIVYDHDEELLPKFNVPYYIQTLNKLKKFKTSGSFLSGCNVSCFFLNCKNINKNPEIERCQIEF